MAEDTSKESAGKATREGRDKRGYIQYIGLATVRQITREDWEAAGVTDQDSVTWSSHNGCRVQRADLSDAAYNIGVRPDTFMVLIGGDPEEGSLQSHPQADYPPAAQQTPMPDPNLYGR